MAVVFAGDGNLNLCALLEPSIVAVLVG